jgi:hypothetical protein
MRLIVDGVGMLARPPTPTEYEFLSYLQKERGYTVGNEPVM